MKFLELAAETIKIVKQPLTVSEIWNKAKELDFHKELKSKGKTPWDTLSSQMFVDVRDNENSIFESIGQRPAKFWIKGMELNPIQENMPKEEKIEKNVDLKLEKYLERDLHPLLVKYADTFYHFRGRGAKLKTIYHENSKRMRKATTIGYIRIWSAFTFLLKIKVQ